MQQEPQLFAPEIFRHASAEPVTRSPCLETWWPHLWIALDANIGWHDGAGTVQHLSKEADAEAERLREAEVTALTTFGEFKPIVEKAKLEDTYDYETELEVDGPAYNDGLTFVATVFDAIPEKEEASQSTRGQAVLFWRLRWKRTWGFQHLTFDSVFAELIRSRDILTEPLARWIFFG